MDKAEGNSLTLVRTFNAPIEKVWAAWTEPEQFSKWYGSPGKLTGTKIDLQVGGEWEATTELPDGTKYPAVAVYRTIKKLERLVFEYQNVEDRTDTKVETMTVTFEDLGGATRMTFNQTGNLPDAVYATGLKDGWTGFFNALEESLA